MGIQDYLSPEIVKLIKKRLKGTGIPIEQFVEEALLTKMMDPSSRTVKADTLVRIWDTATKYHRDEKFKKDFFHFNFNIKIYGYDDPHPWDKDHPVLGDNDPIEERKYVMALVDKRKPLPKGPERPKELNFFLE